MGRFLRRAIACEAAWFGVYLLIVGCSTLLCVDRRCNNFLVFRAAVGHLRAGVDLYAAYPREHADLFKYSPTFALLFAPLARMPFAAALLAWNVANVLLVFAALRLALPPRYRLDAIQLTGIGLVTTVDGSQSNGLVAAFIILAFAALERNRLAAAASAVAAGTLIKLFPIATALFALPRRDRGRFAVICALVGAAAVLLPLVVVDGGILVAEYRSWLHIGTIDALDRGASVMRLMYLAWGYDGPNWPIQLAGTVLLVLPLGMRPARWADPDFRLGFLASLLVYSVIFNHKAEQPSFIIAIVGVAIWHAISPPSLIRDILTGSTYVSTVPMLIAVATSGALGLSVHGAVLGTCVCCFVVWLTMQAELLDLLPDRVCHPERELVRISDEPAM